MAQGESPDNPNSALKIETLDLRMQVISRFINGMDLSYLAPFRDRHPPHFSSAVQPSVRYTGANDNV